MQTGVLASLRKGVSKARSFVRPVSRGSQVRAEVDRSIDAGSGEPTSHREALKSTSITGGATVVEMLIRMVRTKVLAVLLGPAGIGLEAIFDSVLSLTKMVVDLGVTSSGVRQIAAAAGSGDRRVIARTVITLRCVCLVLGVIGAVALFFAREPVSRLAFGSSDYAAAIGWLAIIPLLGGIAGRQGAILQGMRRITDLAKIRILGALIGTGTCIPIVWIWGKDGIPAYLIFAAASGLLVSWVYARRVSIEPIRVPLREAMREARSLLQLGLVFVASGVMTAGTLFLLRVLVTRQEGVEGAGQFQAASALSMVYVGFVLQAMGTDFYPRLTAVAEDNRRCNQLVNEQAEISILLALPGVLATLALAPWVIHVFYSSRFEMAVEILCWQVTGMLLRVISWPMGFMVVAKGRAAAFFWIDFAAYSVYAGLGWLGLKLFGLPGVGIAFLSLCVFHWCVTYVVVRRMSGFRWSGENIRLSQIAVITAVLTLWCRLVLREPWATAIGCFLAVCTGLLSAKKVIRLLGVDKVNSYLRKIRLPFQFREREGVAVRAAPVGAD